MFCPCSLPPNEACRSLRSCLRHHAKKENGKFVRKQSNSLIQYALRKVSSPPSPSLPSSSFPSLPPSPSLITSITDRKYAPGSPNPNVIHHLSVDKRPANQTAVLCLLSPSSLPQSHPPLVSCHSMAGVLWWWRLIIPISPRPTGTKCTCMQ